jgi:hypothetical protein
MNNTPQYSMNATVGETQSRSGEEKNHPTGNEPQCSNPQLIEILRREDYLHYLLNY